MDRETLCEKSEGAHCRHRSLQERQFHRHLPPAAVVRRGELRIRLIRESTIKDRLKLCLTILTNDMRGDAPRVNAVLRRTTSCIDTSGKHRHQRLGEAPRARTSATISGQRFQEESRKHFEMNTMPIGCDVPSGSVMGLPPDADEAGGRSLQTQDASGRSPTSRNPWTT